MKPLFYLSGVETDLIRAAIWYESQQRGLGKRFLAEFDAACHKIPYYPEMYSTIYKNVRRVVMHDFQFSVYYQVLENHIEVIAALSNRINPQETSSRITTPSKH
jgi:toxin ParE1/3/4